MEGGRMEMKMKQEKEEKKGEEIVTESFGRPSKAVETRGHGTWPIQCMVTHSLSSLMILRLCIDIQS